MILAVMVATQVVARQRPEWDLIPDLCNAGAVLYQLRYQANKAQGIDIFLPKWKLWIAIFFHLPVLDLTSKNWCD